MALDDRYTTPALPDMVSVPVASGVGRAPEGVAPAASATRYFPWAGMLPDKVVTADVVPVAARYCTLRPVSGIAAPVVFWSSMKSLVYGAPVLPPPPYTSLMTSPVLLAEAGATRARGAATSASPTAAVRAVAQREWEGRVTLILLRGAVVPEPGRPPERCSAQPGGVCVWRSPEMKTSGAYPSGRNGRYQEGDDRARAAVNFRAAVHLRLVELRR